MQFEHRPVLLDEALEGLALKPDGIYVDGTFGRGGHTQAVLHRLGPNGKMLVFDKDPEAVQTAREMAAQDERLKFKHGSFAMLRDEVEKFGWLGKVNGILLDLGVSSPQLDDPARGFSFMREGPLDMRMDTTQGIPVAEWLEGVTEQELKIIIRNYGEERFARRIARAIVEMRDKEVITTTAQLAKVIANAVPAARERRIHPATRTFQAIRIFINRELEELELFLDQVLDVLAVGGRLCVISFHSLEDRIVKRFIQKHERVTLPRGLPLRDDEIRRPRLRRIGRAVKATPQEAETNRRARSARLRIAEKMV